MKEPLQSDAGSFITADPFRCRVWDLNDRMEEYVTEESCRAEIASVERDGQLVPVVGRVLRNNPDFDIEIICGARRLFVARHLKVSIRVQLRELTDRQAAVAVKTENSLRKETSPYERGLWLAKLLRQGIYRSRDEMARSSRDNPHPGHPAAEIHGTAGNRHRSVSEPTRHPGVVGSGAYTRHGRTSAADYSRNGVARSAPPRPALPPSPFTKSSWRRPHEAAARDSKLLRRVVKSPDGATVLRFEHRRKEVVLRIPNALVNPAIEAELTQVVAAVLITRPLASSQPATP